MGAARTYDVLVLGGGNAALCAAISARRAGASVQLVECAPKHFRGGNSRHTRNLRCMHDAPADVLTGAYPEEEYWQDLLKVTGGETNETLARMTIRHTATCRRWMIEHGVEVSYDTEVIGLELRDGHFESASVVRHGIEYAIGAKAMVAAAGGFEANLEWLRE